MSIRIIYDYSTKSINQYEQIKYFFPIHDAFLYKNQKTIFEQVKYNIFIDVISEQALNILPAECNILIVNEEYLNHYKYLRREYFIDKPLIEISNIVEYYFCLTKYAYKFLRKQNINKNKLVYLGGLTSNIYNQKQNNKYILYEIDMYSGQNNLLFLKIWLNNFTNKNKILIIKYVYEKDKLVEYFKQLINHKKKLDPLKIYTYKNIILLTDITNYENDIYVSIINTSYYQLLYKIYENIFKNRIIITKKNSISKYILKKSKFLYEDDIKAVLNNLFNNSKNYNYLDKLNKRIIKTKKFINDFFNITNFTVSIKTNIQKIKENNNKMELVNINHEKIKPIMKQIDDKLKKEFKIQNFNLDSYYRILKDSINKTKYAYVTIIFCDNKFLNTILLVGYVLKYIAKVKYNTICLIQDKYNENFPGLNEQEINNIKQVFDIVIGIDLLKTNLNLNDFRSYHPNILYYSTKILCLGLIEYEKILFFDGSTLINKNIDYMFDIYNKSTYYDVLKLNRGIVGNFFIIKPKKYYFYKALYLLNNYGDIFPADFAFFTNDEDILFYSIYPDWNDKLINVDNIYFYNNQLPLIDRKESYPYEVYFYNFLKPFRFTIDDAIKERFLFNEYHYCYKIWDEYVIKLLKDFPLFFKYYEYIHTYRYTGY
jgi:hypothetical protein